MKGVSASALAVWLHSKVCYSLVWSEECQRPDGGSHAKTALPAAKEILSADNPASALHQHLCHVEIQSAHGGYYKGCPVRQAHDKKCWEFLADLAS